VDFERSVKTWKTLVMRIVKRNWKVVKIVVMLSLLNPIIKYMIHSPRFWHAGETPRHFPAPTKIIGVGNG
jgi:hypothetical protein